jgi:hypothetical protein
MTQMQRATHLPFKVEAPLFPHRDTEGTSKWREKEARVAPGIRKDLPRRFHPNLDLPVTCSLKGLAGRFHVHTCPHRTPPCTLPTETHNTRSVHPNLSEDFKSHIRACIKRTSLKAEAMSSMEQQQQTAPPHLRAVADFLRSSKAGMRIRTGVIGGKRADYFKGA